MIFSIRVKTLYPYINVLLLLVGLGWCLFAPELTGPKNAILYSLLAYAAIAIILRWLYKNKAFSIDTLYFVGYFFDGAIIATLIKFTGGLSSEYYLVFFPVVVLLSVFSENWKSIVGAAWFGFCYFISVLPLTNLIFDIQAVLFRLGLIWLSGLIAFAIAQYMRTSEKKLLNTLDTLNQRTWELESSQLQLSNIYETTRALSGILDLQQLLLEILRIAQVIFHYNKCDIYLSSKRGEQIQKCASLENDNRHIFEKPEPYNRDISEIQKLIESSSRLRSS